MRIAGGVCHFDVRRDLQRSLCNVRCLQARPSFRRKEKSLKKLERINLSCHLYKGEIRNQSSLGILRSRFLVGRLLASSFSCVTRNDRDSNPAKAFPTKERSATHNAAQPSFRSRLIGREISEELSHSLFLISYF